MKKLFYISFIFSCLLSSYKSKAQLLNAGDAVVSVSPGLFSGVNSCGPNPINSTLYANDTVLTIVRFCKAPASSIGSCWSMTPLEYSNYTYKNPNWIRKNLGNIFGICIDNNKNIYVTSTGFYGQQYTGISTGSIFKIDGITGSISLFADLHTMYPTDPLSLGNIKSFGNRFFVSDLKDGKIYMLSSTGTILASYDPLFGDQSKPFGLAIRNQGGGARLFFSRNNFNATTTSIYSISFSASSFGSDLIQEVAPSLLNTNKPITDIAFTKDFKNMLFAERSTSSWTSTTMAHQSKIYEYKETGGIWVNSVPNYYVGQIAPNTNTAGGISFSQSMIGSDCKKWFCDTTVVSTSDAIFFGAPSPCSLVYGITGFKHASGSGSNSGINFDIDNRTTLCPKTYLGDVEVCDTTIECSTCRCGEWGNGIPPIFPGGTGNPLTLTVPMPGGNSMALMTNCGASYSFIKGAVSGTLNANYSCIGDCNKVINWQLINTITNAQAGSGNLNNGAINLSQFNNLACGSYKFIFTPKCGNNTCSTCEYFINIVCDPPPCCPPRTQVTIQPQNANYTSTNNPNGWGTYSQSFTLNSNVPMSEIRIDVEHFELNSPDPDCIPCKNIPKTWGSLLGAAYNGNGFVRPISSLPFSPSIWGNGRELVYKPGSLITINNGVVNVNVAMPNASPIDCCVLTANICLKFTFKDANCRECTYLYCNQNIEIKKSVNGNPNGNQLNNVNKTVQKSIF